MEMRLSEDLSHRTRENDAEIKRLEKVKQRKKIKSVEKKNRWKGTRENMTLL